MFIRLTTFLFSISCALSQFNYKLSGGYYDQAGNTDYKYYNGGFSVTAYGDFSVGGIMVKDSELLLSVDKNFSTYSGQDYEDDQNILFLFDLWANGKFSPFVIAEKSYDTYRGIKDRTNFGLGAKYRVLVTYSPLAQHFFQKANKYWEITGYMSTWISATP